MVTQNDLITSRLTGEKILTCKREKLYTFYIVNEDGFISEVDWENEILLDGWRDHCIVPKDFHELAKDIGCKYDNETFAYIVEQFVENYLDSDWHRLADYLPEDSIW